MRQIKAILIDPFACTVTGIELPRGDLDAIYKALSHESMPVDLVTCAYPSTLKGHDTLFVDDEGLMKSPERFFVYTGLSQPLAGKGLIIGADAEGESASAETHVDIARINVMFVERISGMFFTTNTPWEPT